MSTNPSVDRGQDRTARRIWRSLSDFTAYSISRFYADNCFQTAASLTYTTLLAIVPLMTIGFAIFTAFPAFNSLQNEVKATIFRNIVPEIGDVILQYLNRFVANAGHMTVFGVIGLAISAVLLIWTIEGSFAGIWRERRPRSLVVRILSFWAIVSLTPLLVGASLSASGALSRALVEIGMRDRASPWLEVGWMLPALFSFAGFSLLYFLAPNRPVAVADAGVGGVVGAVLFEASKAGFTWYLRAYPAYQTIYGALATIPIFLFWLYVAWSTVLFGAVVAAALPEWRAGSVARVGAAGLTAAQRIGLALGVLHELHRASRRGIGLNNRALVVRLDIDIPLIDAMLEQLRLAHWVAPTDRGRWVGTRDLARASVGDLAFGLGLGLRGDLQGIFPREPVWCAKLGQLIATVEGSQAELLAMSIADLFDEPPSAELAAS